MKLADFPEYKNTKPAVLIRAALDYLFEDDQVFEIRIPKTKYGTISGYFKDKAAASLLVSKENNEHGAIYVTINPVQKALLARCENRLERYSQILTSDAEIEKRRWFLLDFDPKRPAGISATEEEKKRAFECAERVIDWLTSIGWPQPVLADSGNGAHVMYRCDEPNDLETRSMFDNATRMLASLFDTSEVKIDTTVFNAARVWKLYGTVAAKGSSTDERPHRVAKFIKMPLPAPEVVHRSLIDALAAPLRDASTEQYKDATGEYIQDMQKWLTDRGLTVVSGPRPLIGSDGQKWEIEHCPFNHSHQRPMIGLLNNRPIFRCLHDSCSGYKWKEFREKVDPTFRDPEVIYVRLREWTLGEDPEPSGELVQTACALGPKLQKLLKELKKVAPRERYKILDDAITEEKKRYRKYRESQGHHDEKGNIVGLIKRVEAIQQAGEIPVFWTNKATRRIHVGSRGDIEADRYTEQHALELMYRFHSMGDVWVKSVHADQAVRLLAARIVENPIANWLKSLKWDQTERLSTWLPEFMGTEDNEYTRAVGRKWMISAVARGIEPGCQADHMLIFEGKQGIGKSRAFRILGGKFYTEYSGGVKAGNLNHKDMVAVIMDKMIVEMSELAALRKADMESFKALLSTPVDDARLAYAHEAMSYPRTCVFGGTTNEMGGAYIMDPTGARRFWPVTCGVVKAVNVEGLAAIRDQLWAEAVEAYMNDEDWWSVPLELTTAEQSKRQVSIDEHDPWYGLIIQSLLAHELYVQKVWELKDDYSGGIPNGFKMVRLANRAALMHSVFGIEPERMTPNVAVRLGKIMNMIGFSRSRPAKPLADGSTWAYDLKQERCDRDLWKEIQSVLRSIAVDESAGIVATKH